MTERIGHGKSGRSTRRASPTALRRRLARSVLHDGLSRDDPRGRALPSRGDPVAELDNWRTSPSIHGDFGRTPDNRPCMAMVAQGDPRPGWRWSAPAALTSSGGNDILPRSATRCRSRTGRLRPPRDPRCATRSSRCGAVCANFVKLLDFGPRQVGRDRQNAASTSSGMTRRPALGVARSRPRASAASTAAPTLSTCWLHACGLSPTGAPPFRRRQRCSMSRHRSVSRCREGRAAATRSAAGGRSRSWWMLAKVRLMIASPDPRRGIYRGAATSASGNLARPVVSPGGLAISESAASVASGMLGGMSGRWSLWRRQPMRTGQRARRRWSSCGAGSVRARWHGAGAAEPRWWCRTPRK